MATEGGRASGESTSVKVLAPLYMVFHRMPHESHSPMTRSFRLSLRTWMVLFTILTVILGYWTIQASSQRRIANALVANGARIMYQYQFDNFDDEARYSSNYDATPPWLAKWIGIDYCSPIVKVSSIHADKPSEIAELCGKLPNLRTLAIQDTSLEDADLEAIVGHQRLRGLHLRGTQISDEAVPYLATFTRLHVLNIQGTSLSPTAVESLRAALPTTRIHVGAQSGGVF